MFSFAALSVKCKWIVDAEAAFRADSVDVSHDVSAAFAVDNDAL